MTESKPYDAAAILSRDLLHTRSELRAQGRLISSLQEEVQILKSGHTARAKEERRLCLRIARLEASQTALATMSRLAAAAPPAAHAACAEDLPFGRPPRKREEDQEVLDRADLATEPCGKLSAELIEDIQELEALWGIRVQEVRANVPQQAPLFMEV